MNIYIVNPDNLFLNLNNEKIVSGLRQKMKLKKEPKLIYTRDSVEQNITKDDIVILGLGKVENDQSKFIKWIKHQITILKNKQIQPILCTEWQYYYPENKNSYIKSNVNLQIQDLATKFQLKTLDISSFLNAWYLSLKEDERENKLEKKSESPEYLMMNEASQYEVLSQYILNWLLKNVLTKQLVEDYYYGASMYPEVWDIDTFKNDIKHARKMGMNVIRIGEFFWEKLEPENNDYNMDYLRELLNIRQKEGMKDIVEIPSPTPPRWFTVRYPESKITNSNGEVEEHGSRQHVCTNHLEFRKKIYQLTCEIGRVVNEYENVILFQIDNEYKCHVDLCYCDTCTNLWGKWLKTHYKTIKNLNERWGTDVWSEKYNSFVDVVTPTKTPFIHNSALMNAFRYFTADTINDMASGTSQILTATSSLPVTHNSALGFNLENYALFTQLDIVGFDTYAPHNQYWGYAMNLNLWRNVKESDEYLLLETSTSHVGHLENYVDPHPKNYLKTEIFLGYASGLKSFVYWPFRGQPVGVEQPHSAVITQSGGPDLGYQGVIEGGKILEKIKPLLKESEVSRSKIAIIYSDMAKRFYNVETGGIYEYRALITDFYHSLISRGISVELIPEEADLSYYDCILVPFVRNISSAFLERLKSFEKEKGKIIFGPMTGDRTEDLTWYRENGLGEIGKLFNIKNVIQYISRNDNTKLKAEYRDKNEEFGGLVTVFETDSQPEVQINTEIINDGYTFLTHNEDSIYLGALPENLQESAFWDEFIQREVKPFDADSAFLEVENGIIKYRRESETYIQFYLANMSGHQSIIHLHQKAVDVDGKSYNTGDITLEKYQTIILKVLK